MYMSNISGIFQHNKPNILNRQSGMQTPLNDALNKAADRTIDTQQKSSDYEFQDIINGDTSLPDGTTMKDIENLLTATQQVREKYLKD